MKKLLEHDGLWGLLAVALLVLGLTLLYRPASTSEKTWYLNGTFSNVAGLKVGSNVMLSGLPVGYIEDIRILPDLQVQVRIALPSELEVPDDSDLRIQSNDIFATPHLALTLGGGFDLLGDGDEVMFTQSGVDFLKLFRKLLPADQQSTRE